MSKMYQSIDELEKIAREPFNPKSVEDDMVITCHDLLRLIAVVRAAKSMHDIKNMTHVTLAKYCELDEALHNALEEMYR